MAVQIQVQVTGAAVSNGGYSVTWTVTSATDMPEHIFRVRRTSAVFDGVISPADLQYPTSPSTLYPYYRASTAYEVYPDLATAKSAQQNIAAAIAELVAAYKDELADFLVTTTETFE